MISLTSVMRAVAALPPVRTYRLASYRKRFFAPGSKWPRFYGRYVTRQDAEAAAESGSKLVGYDHAVVADVSVGEMSTIWTSDYPVIYWLSKLVTIHKKLFDLGGHVGTKYRAWAEYLDLPKDFLWMVCDLPAIISHGRQLSTGLPRLRFTSDRRVMADHDVLLASGVLQYADFLLPEVLGDLSSTPSHILINKLPTHAEADAFTLENLHHAAVPYRIFNEAAFLEKLGALGYQVVDRWVVPESAVRVPFTTLGESVHVGFYLRQQR